MQLQLDAERREILEDILRRALGDLREEIYKTETAPYKEQLKLREAVLQSLLDDVSPASSATPAI
jgi:hypothetical protein